MDSKHPYPYSPHFPSSNKVAWQENQAVPLSPSVAPNFQDKQANNVENVAILITTTPACDVSMSISTIRIVIES